MLWKLYAPGDPDEENYLLIEADTEEQAWGEVAKLTWKARPLQD